MDKTLYKKINTLFISLVWLIVASMVDTPALFFVSLAAAALYALVGLDYGSKE